MRLALFDLDHTLLDGDSNTLWLHFLSALGLLPDGALQRQAEEYARYEAGTLDIESYLRFQLSLLVGRPLTEWLSWRKRFVAEVIAARISDAANAALERHRAQGDRLALVTATHSFLAEGIAGLWSPLAVIAPRAEIRDDHLSGDIVGDICFGRRKVDCLHAWLEQEGLAMSRFASIHFYSDSFNDLPLLDDVTHPVAINADPRLGEVARLRGWPRGDWRIAGR